MSNETTTFELIRGNHAKPSSKGWQRLFEPLKSGKFHVVWLVGAAVLLTIYWVFDLLGLLGIWYDDDTFYYGLEDSFVAFPTGAMNIALVITFLTLTGTLLYRIARKSKRGILAQHARLGMGALLYYMPAFVSFILLFLPLPLLGEMGGHPFPTAVPFLFLLGLLTTSVGLSLAGIANRGPFFVLVVIAILPFWVLLLLLGDFGYQYIGDGLGVLNGFAVHMPILFCALGLRSYYTRPHSAKGAEDGMRGWRYFRASWLIAAGATWWFVAVTWAISAAFGAWR